MPEDISTFEIPDSEFEAAASPGDLKGRLNIRLDSAMQQEIENIRDDGRYPLNSSSEVVRYCCLLGLERLRQWKPAPTLLGRIKTASALVLRDKMQSESIELLNRLDERVEWYIQNAHYDSVLDLVAQVRSYFDDVSDEFWASYIQTEIDKRFIAWMDRIDILKGQ